MKLRHAAAQVLRRAYKGLFRLMGRDSISLQKIRPRRDLLHIGTAYGGWVVPLKLLTPDSICYCFGCGEDISFDLGLIDRVGCRVHGFDPTPRAIRHAREHAAHHDRYHFHEIGIWDTEDVLKFYAPRDPAHVSHSILNLQGTEEYFEARVRRLRDIMQENGHERLDLLKLDIEGAEYKVVASIIEDRISIRILCIEYDECFNPLDRLYKQRIRQSVRDILGYGYSLVCAQGNGNYTFVQKAG
ncbi:MAG: FkbM family methyltransferase [Planctomycetota bacterium]